MWGAVAPDRSPHPFREGTEMPTIITVNDLRTILGVSVSLYPDTVLADIIDAAEQVTLPMLVKYSSAIDAVELNSNIATYKVLGTNNFAKDQSVIITGVGAPFNGTFTIANINEEETYFTVAITNANILPRKVIPSGTATLSGASTYVGNPVVEQAVTALSKEIFQARNSSGGAIQGVDFQISPFALGRSLFNRVSGMLGGLLDVETMVG